MIKLHIETDGVPPVDAEDVLLVAFVHRQKDGRACLTMLDMEASREELTKAVAAHVASFSRMAKFDKIIRNGFARARTQTLTSGYMLHEDGSSVQMGFGKDGKPYIIETDPDEKPKDKGEE